MKEKLFAGIFGALLGAAPVASSAQESMAENLNENKIENPVDSMHIKNVENGEQSKKKAKTLDWDVAIHSNLNFDKVNHLTDKSVTPLNSEMVTRGDLQMFDYLRNYEGAKTLAALEEGVKKRFASASFEEKIGALNQLSKALYMHWDGKNSGSVVPMDDIVKNLIDGQGQLEKDEKLVGDCRHYSFLTSEIAKKSLDLNSSVISGNNHVMAQVLDNNRNAHLIDDGTIISDIDGKPLRNKDDIDIAMMRYKENMSISDITISPEKNQAVYENRYNNFSGFWRKLQNRNNSEREKEFLMDGNLELFASLNERGVTTASIEKGSIGAQAYWVRDNNEYSRFLKEVQGVNLAAYLPVGYSPKGNWEHSLFANLGFYKTVMDVGFEGAVAGNTKVKTVDAQLDIEDYLKHNFNTYLSAGLISKLAQYNCEISRNIKDTTSSNPQEIAFSLSPFVSLEIPQDHGKIYLAAGSEVTDYMALPNQWKLSTVPWFRTGFKYQKQEIDFNASLKGEFQNASQRFDLESFLKKGDNLVKIRAFYEHYTKEFKENNLFSDASGIEAGIGRDLKNGYQVFLMLSAKSENTGAKNILINLGLKF